MENTKALDFSIERNFKFKNKYSTGSLEHIAYARVIEGESTVENRERKCAWVQELLSVSRNAMRDIIRIKTTGRDSSDKELSEQAQKYSIEQLEMSVLNKLGWSYEGSFLPDANREIIASDGSVHLKSEMHPELYFTLSTRKFPWGEHPDEVYYRYVASYGIMDNVSSDKFGSYVYCDTLDEALEFINDQLMTIGRRELQRNYIREEIVKKMKINGISEIPDSNELRNEYRREAREKANRRINQEITEESVRSKLHHVRASMDITTLPDLIDRFLLAIAEHHLTVAKEGEFRERKARGITDTTAVHLDDEVREIEFTPPAKPSTGEEILRQAAAETRRHKGSRDSLVAQSGSMQSDVLQSAGLIDSTAAPIDLDGVHAGDQVNNEIVDVEEVDEVDSGNFDDVAQVSVAPGEASDSEMANVMELAKNAKDNDEPKEPAEQESNLNQGNPTLNPINVNGDIEEDSLESIQHGSIDVNGDIEEDGWVNTGSINVNDNVDDSFMVMLHGSVNVNSDIEDSLSISEPRGQRSPDDIETSHHRDFVEALSDDMDAIWFDESRYPVRSTNPAISEDELGEFLV